jgi:hypothetical protein
MSSTVVIVSNLLINSYSVNVLNLYDKKILFSTGKCTRAAFPYKWEDGVRLFERLLFFSCCSQCPISVFTIYFGTRLKKKE